jgi:nuclear pore complex protein Nup88
MAESAGALSASVAAQTLEAASRSELRALAEGIPKDKMKSAEQIMKECGITSDMKVGDPASNEALAKCASMLKEIYVDYARDVHDEVRTTALRLTAEIRRQKEEVAALLDSANDAIERHNELVERLESAATRHEGIRSRLRNLAEKEKSIPHPLTKAEKLFKSQMEAFQADLPLLKQRIEELTERAAIATERDDDDIGYVGSRRVVGASTASDTCGEDERKVSKALAEQGEMIKKNAAKAKLIEELLQK